MNARSRRDILAGAALGLGVVTLSGCSKPSATGGSPATHGPTEETAGLTPDQAVTKLTEGNARFVAMKEVEPNLSKARLTALSKGQHPFVGILGCVDSRVPPELVFDRGLGDVFDARIAGAIPDDAAIGSLEFGVEEFDVPLLVVLGHSKCGAVSATVKALESGNTTMPGRIGSVAAPIIPAVKAVEAQGKSGADLVNAAVREVVRTSVAALSASPVLTERIATGKLKVKGAFYDLESGKVEFLPD